MMILTIRTDSPEAEIGLYNDNDQINYHTWPAHRQLAETIHQKIATICQGTSLTDLGGVVVFRGPGSFTGLRIGLSVANALAYGLNVPIVGSTKADWIQNGISQLLAGQSDKVVLPSYGAPVHITLPKK